MSTTNDTAQHVAQSLTGFDEIAIEQRFGRAFVDLRKDPFKLLRALVFTDMRRKGTNDGAAFHDAMSLTIVQLEDYFADEPAELDEQEPDTELGNEPAPSL